MNKNKPIKITDLVQGDEVLCWMRLGLPLKVGRKGNGSLYRYVPSKPGAVKHGDLTRFTGWVVKNNTEEQVLSLHVTEHDTHKIAYNREKPSLIADVHYTAFKRVVKVSEIAFEPNQENLTFPANLDSARFKPYRTLIEVKLK